MKDTRFYVTTPIYYVNDKPHIGHAYTTVLADVLARYHRLMGLPTHFLTGTDEHGQKVQNAAAKNNIPPLDYCDQVIQSFKKLWVVLGITNDDFIRTTQERHKSVVRQILTNLYEKGDIYKGAYEGWYCVGCEAYVTDKDIDCGESGNEHKCPLCHRELENRQEPSYFFKMGSYQDALIKHIQDNPEFIQPEKFRNETLGFLCSKDKDGNRNKLGDLCIGRPKERLSWGIPLPFDEDFVTYVWFDALVNYISAVGYLKDEELFKKWWPVNYHLIGKDILKPHTVYWPTMLMAMGVPLPKTVFVHGWWLTNNTKMSKSLHNVVNPLDMVDSYGADALRYYLSAAMTLGQDANFTEKLFNLKYNADLANDLGNLASRALTMLNRFNGGLIPDVQASDDEGVAQLKKLTIHAAEAMPEYIDNMQLDTALADVMAAVREGNRYWTEQQPWVMAKEGRNDDLARVIRNSLECLRIVSGLLYPVMPVKMAELRKALGMSDDSIEPNYANLKEWYRLAPGTQTQVPPPLFPKVLYTEPTEEKPAAEEKPAKPAKKDKKKDAQSKVYELISIDDFSKVQLKTAEVIEAEPVPNADKLLKLQIRLGDETRQIVSGIAQWYKPEQLIGKTIIVVANLKPAELRGVQSCGMLLAAKQGDKLSLVTIDGPLSSGASIG